MKKYCLFLVIVVFIISVASVSTTVAAEDQKLVVGKRFVYEQHIAVDNQFAQSSKESREFVVTKVKGNNKSFDVTINDGKGSTRKERVDSEDVPYLNIPAEKLSVGKSWSEEYPIREMGSRFRAISSDCEVKEFATITVPAGEFSAYYIVCELTNQPFIRSVGQTSTGGTISLWYDAKISGMPVIFSDTGKQSKMTSSPNSSGPPIPGHPSFGVSSSK